MAHTEVVTYTTRSKDPTFPECLTILPQRTDIPSWAVQSYVRHNMAVRDWQRHNVGAINTGTPVERALLGLAAAIERYNLTNGASEDGYLFPHVVAPMVAAFRHALNGDTGMRLDCGTLDDWAVSVCEAAGWDADIGDWKK